MKLRLLDTNLLIALFWPSHVHHRLAANWFLKHRKKGWATCPLTQPGFVRIVSNPGFSRDAIRPADAIKLLQLNTQASDHQFWPINLPLDEWIRESNRLVKGHQQVTDAYLIGLAHEQRGILATLDSRIRNLFPSSSSRVLEVVD